MLLRLAPSASVPSAPAQIEVEVEPTASITGLAAAASAAAGLAADVHAELLVYDLDFGEWILPGNIADVPAGSLVQLQLPLASATAPPRLARLVRPPPLLGCSHPPAVTKVLPPPVAPPPVIVGIGRRYRPSSPSPPSVRMPPNIHSRAQVKSRCGDGPLHH
jgi:hypothetical protein